MPTVSVTIPTYNRSILIKDAINSVLNQSFQDFEIVIIDDGSTDDTKSVIESFTDSRIKYFYKENGGCASARNFGIKNCTGQYIAFLDSDDLWPENFLEIMIGKLQSNPDYGASYCLIYGRYPDGKEEVKHEARLCKSGKITKDLFKTGFIWLQTSVFRREALADFHFDNSIRNAADTDALLRLSTKIKFLFVTETHGILRLNHGISPRLNSSTFNCNRIRILERFYYKLGGNRFVDAATARRKISHAYHHVAQNFYSISCRKAALYLYFRAIKYWPFDMRLYVCVYKSWMLQKNKDKNPKWKMPTPLEKNL
ncbi:MAG: hypothetical protein A2Y10_18635 [Planctomycetes bacterium GWF2_41_51]|nr:MAG: hypothetical protein A2Y10_18635 [Planctomycetes bacterium GWF2_41_51]HBG27135.1 hypothetical protein [Phycisphaerales bacterium]